MTGFRKTIKLSPSYGSYNGENGKKIDGENGKKIDGENGEKIDGENGGFLTIFAMTKFEKK